MKKSADLGRPDRTSPVAVARKRKTWGGWPHPDQDPSCDPGRCRCQDCRALDRAHPREGYQLRML
jgi:hypothetical protein